GLAHNGLVMQHRRRLRDHQSSGSILSDPHMGDTGLRFPFLVVEAKGYIQNGISAASMLVILQDLSNQVGWSTGSAPDPESITQGSPVLCLSMVTAGPTHERGVLFIHNGALHMHGF
ncbi:hypothetical protein K505DRAFT_261535, partial [Melanomma pulvis-pyrius CBS 109.77]